MSISHWLILAGTVVLALLIEGVFELLLPALYESTVEPRLRALAARPNSWRLLTGLWVLGIMCILLGWHLSINRGHGWGFVLFFGPLPGLAALSSVWFRVASRERGLPPDV